MLFLTEEGLHVARKDLYQQNENQLSFEIFKPVRK
jgi:hypothetical protein